jgi:hypothetical protein
MITLQNAVLYASRTDADDKLPKAGLLLETLQMKNQEE